LTPDFSRRRSSAVTIFTMLLLFLCALRLGAFCLPGRHLHLGLEFQICFDLGPDLVFRLSDPILEFASNIARKIGEHDVVDIVAAHPTERPVLAQQRTP
jgi:hypothetical protein